MIQLQDNQDNDIINELLDNLSLVRDKSNISQWKGEEQNVTFNAFLIVLFDIHCIIKREQDVIDNLKLIPLMRSELNDRYGTDQIKQHMESGECYSINSWIVQLLGLCACVC